MIEAADTLIGTFLLLDQNSFSFVILAVHISNEE